MSTSIVPVHPRVLLNTSRGFYFRRKLTSGIMLGLTGLATLVAILPLAWILFYVTQEGGRFLGLDFLTQLPTPVGVPGGGVANALLGSALVVGIACLISIPISIVAAFYVAENPETPLGLAVRFGTDVLAGVPSIVMGIFAYSVIVLTQRHFSALSGGFALAIIMTPIVTRTTEEMMRLVPNDLREGALALGAPRWKATLQVLFPAAASGVLTGVMLAIARAAGEAAPMIFTAFGNPYFNLDPNQPTATLPQTIYIYAISPYKDWHDKAWTTALVLIALVLGLNVLARGFMWWRTRRLAGQ
jgi:phosphate transport system permease protein